MVEFGSSLFHLMDYVTVMVFDEGLDLAAGVNLFDFFKVLLVVGHVPEAFQLLQDFTAEHLHVLLWSMLALIN